MTQRLQVESCAHCGAIGVFGPSGELPCRHCNRLQIRPISAGYSGDAGNALVVLNQMIFSRMQMEVQRPQGLTALWQQGAALLTFLVALALIVLAVAGVIPAAALLLALVFGAIAFWLARVI